MYHSHISSVCIILATNLFEMKKALFIITAFTALLFSTNINAQKVKLKSGKLGVLNGQSTINLEYDYSDMGVGKYKDEADYIAKKKEDYNKKEAGRGDKWEEAWVADRSNRFQPQFEELFNKYSPVQGGDHADAKYTLIFKTKFTEPGFNIHITRKNAEIDGEAWIVETANPEKVIAKITVEKCQGRTFGGYDYDSGTRIQEAYAVAGKGLGKFLKKEVK